MGRRDFKKWKGTWARKRVWWRRRHGTELPILEFPPTASPRLLTSQGCTNTGEKEYCHPPSLEPVGTRPWTRGPHFLLLLYDTEVWDLAGNSIPVSLEEASASEHNAMGWLSPQSWGSLDCLLSIQFQVSKAWVSQLGDSPWYLGHSLPPSSSQWNQTQRTGVLPTLPLSPSLGIRFSITPADQVPSHCSRFDSSFSS